MSLGQAAIHFESLLRQPFCPATTILRRNKSPQPHDRDYIGQTGVGSGIDWVFRDRLLEEAHSISESFSTALVPVITTLQIGFVSFRVDAPSLTEVRLVVRSQFDTNLPCDGLGDFGLQGQNIAQVAVITFGPKMSVREPMDQLGRDADAIPRAQYGSFDDSIHVKFFRYLRKRPVDPLVVHH